MSTQTTKSQEIKRLTSPLTFRDSKAYDCEGNPIKCVETLSEIKYLLEPREGILTDDEIMQYAPESKAASKIRLKRGQANAQDVLLVHESLPWIFGVYYVILLSLSLMFFYEKSMAAMAVLLVLFIIPLIYAYWIFNLKNYGKASKKPETQKATKTKITGPVKENTSLESLSGYEHEVNNLKVIYEVKEKVVKQLIERKFEPPQITYDKFMATIESCNKIFHQQADSALDITKLAVEDTPRVRQELDSKIEIMKEIISQIEELTNELVVNINSDSQTKGEVKVLLDDMENLIGSVKDYGGDLDE